MGGGDGGDGGDGVVQLKADICGPIRIGGKPNVDVDFPLLSTRIFMSSIIENVIVP